MRTTSTARSQWDPGLENIRILRPLASKLVDRNLTCDPMVPIPGPICIDMAFIAAICRLRPPIQPIAEGIFLDRGPAVYIVAPVSGSTLYTLHSEKI